MAKVIVTRHDDDYGFTSVDETGQKIQLDIDSNTTVINQINDELPKNSKDSLISDYRQREKKAEDDIIMFRRDVERLEDKISELKENNNNEILKIENKVNKYNEETDK